MDLIYSSGMCIVNQECVTWKFIGHDWQQHSGVSRSVEQSVRTRENNFNMDTGLNQA